MRPPLIVSSEGGLDEIGLHGPTVVAELKDDHISTFTIRPKDFGLREVPMEAICGGDATQNASMLRSVLEGQGGPCRDIVCLNAGAALYAADVAKDIEEGISLAAEGIDRGEAKAKLEDLIAFTRGKWSYEGTRSSRKDSRSEERTAGAGKTTLVKLLVGLYPPAQGQVLYNGVDSKAIDILELRKQLGFVTQDAQLFSGTIRENLLFVKPDATDQELLDALHKASCDKLLNRAENGLNTTIGEGGIKVSGGEKQRLSIARAILRHPNLLIFDEATSALDSITEEEINSTIRSISDQTRITILIAHRLSTIMHADKIFVLEQGKIIEQGKHIDLLDEKGLYYAMWRQQIGERKSSVSA